MFVFLDVQMLATCGLTIFSNISDDLFPIFIILGEYVVCQCSSETEEGEQDDMGAEK